MAEKRARVPDEKLANPGVPLLSIRDYAVQKGVSHSAIRKAIETGRINLAVNRDELARRRPCIDAAKADEELDRHTDVAMQRLTGSRRGGPGAPKKTGDTPDMFDPAGATRPKPAAPAGQGLSATGSYTQARAVREGYDARMARLTYEEAIGNLVEAGPIALEAARTGRIVREELLNIPARVSVQFAHEHNPHVIEEALIVEINRALESLFAALRMLEPA